MKQYGYGRGNGDIDRRWKHDRYTDNRSSGYSDQGYVSRDDFESEEDRSYRRNLSNNRYRDYEEDDREHSGGGWYGESHNDSGRYRSSWQTSPGRERYEDEYGSGAGARGNYDDDNFSRRYRTDDRYARNDEDDRYPTGQSGWFGESHQAYNSTMQNRRNYNDRQADHQRFDHRNDFYNRGNYAGNRGWFGERSQAARRDWQNRDDRSNQQNTNRRNDTRGYYGGSRGPNESPAGPWRRRSR